MTTPDNLIVAREQARLVRKRFHERLTGNEKHVLNLRYVSAQMTLEAIGQELMLSRERIRQIEAKALRKLRYGRYYPNTKSTGRRLFTWHRRIISDYPTRLGSHCNGTNPGHPIEKGDLYFHRANAPYKNAYCAECAKNLFGAEFPKTMVIPEAV